MRYLIVAILCLSIHCHGPKSARADEPKPATKKLTYTEQVKAFEATVAGLVSKTDEARERYESELKGRNETVGNFANELSEVKSKLKDLTNEVAEVAGEVAEVRKLLSVDTEISIEVPKAADPPDSDSSLKVDAPPAEAADRRTVDAIAHPTGRPGEYEAELIYKPSMTIEIAAPQQMRFNGKVIDIHEWLRRKVPLVEINGNVDAHLRDHGLEGDFSSLNRSQKIQLHSVAHTYGIPLKSAAPRKVVVRAPTVVLPQASNCANGNCARQWAWSSRPRLFGRR